MTVCIVIATRNSGETLAKCMASIAMQTNLPESVIVQDGASVDNTVDILRSYETELPGILDWRSEPDEGIADAWNKALLRLRGDWILFIGADDHLSEPRILAMAEEALATCSSSIRIAYGDVLRVCRDGTPLATVGMSWEAVRRDFRRSLHCLQHQAVFHHRSFFDEHGYYDSRMRICADQEMLLRGLLTEDACYFPGLTITHMAMGGISSDYRNITAVNYELLSIQSRRRSVPPWDPLVWRIAKGYVAQALYMLGGNDFALKVANLYRVYLRGKPPLPF